jgi:hypothetical protein
MLGEWNVEKKLESQLRKKQIKERDLASIKRKANTIQGSSSLLFSLSPSFSVPAALPLLRSFLSLSLVLLTFL